MAFWIDTGGNNRTAPLIRFVGNWTALRKSTPLPWEVYQLDPAVVPFEGVVTSRHQRIPEFITISGRFSVCEEARDLIEALEPGVHEFFPLYVIPKNPEKILLRMDGTPLIQPYFLINIQTRLDAVCIEKSDVVVVKGARCDFVNPRQYMHLVEGITLLKSVIAGHHLWQGGFHFTGYMFCSDMLAERIQKLRWKNIRLEHVDEI
jgi:hypothetical protein